MCGFLGEVNYTGESIPVSRFKKLLSLSKSRGPNETKIKEIGQKILFGFNRLSVLDLSSNASQPMWSPSKRYLLMLNGEIYNHQDIRKSFNANDGEISSSGDTATVAYSLDKWGIQKTINKLDGMFAIAIFDSFEKSISLIRDFAGIKPLFYGRDSSVLVFSSQYNQISKHPNFRYKHINSSVLKLYLSQHYIPSPFGILEDTYSLNPGEIITFDANGKRNTSYYWSYPSYSESKINDDNIVSDIKTELSSAIRSEMLSDVPIGGFLSGGVDSPLICFEATKFERKNFNTYSLKLDSQMHDESVLSTYFANELNVNNELIKMNSSNALNTLYRSTRAVGEPFGDFSILPTWEISKTASKDITVALSGDGGDELFFGYERFISIAKNHWLWKQPYLIRYFVRGMDKFFLDEKYVNDCILFNNPGEAHFGLHNRFHSSLMKTLIPSIDQVSLPTGYNNYKYKSPRTVGQLLYEIQKSEFYGMLQKTLIKVDRASMAHGLEVRVPFLKKSMIEKVLKYGVSVHQPLKGRKKILFKILKQSFPNVIPELSKKGFTIPLKNWIKSSLKDEFYDKLLDRGFCDHYAINKKYMEKMLHMHSVGKQDLKWPLYTLYSLAVWDNDWR